MKSVMQEDQLKCVDAEEMRIITNSKHVAEQIKSDKDECKVMHGQKIKKTKRIGRTKFEEHRDGWSKIWKSWEMEEFQN